MENAKVRWIKIIVCIILVELVGILSSLFAGDIKAVYHSLTLPPISPPDYLFGIVWPVLYLLIGIVGYLVTFQKSRNRFKKIILFLIQLFLNFIWSILFFRLDNHWIALAIILLLDVTVVTCIKLYYRDQKAASWALIPYLLWILFATYLNLGIAILN